MILDTIDIYINRTFTWRLSFQYTKSRLLSIIGVCPLWLPVASQLEIWIQPITYRKRIKFETRTLSCAVQLFRAMDS